MTAINASTGTQHPVHYTTVRVSDLDIFYREAGPQTAPLILLFHGLPVSART
jgi:pimeloyl-ACP methyl ester carboxylesterase